MSSRPWTPISIGLILLSFMVFAFLSRKPLCIESKVVDKIDRVSDNGVQATAYRCGLHRSVPFDNKWNVTLNFVSRRVQAVEKFLESMTPFRAHVRVTVLENRPAIYKITDHEIFLGESSLEVPGPLEKGIIKIWLRENSRGLLSDQPLLEESLSDLLLFSVNGKLDLADPLLLSTAKVAGNDKWPFAVKSLAGYCHSPWRQSEHYQLCQREALESQVKDTNLIPLSLRPLLTRAMIKSYSKLSIREKRHFFATLSTTLQNLKIDDSEAGLSSSNLDQQSLVDLSFEMSRLIKTVSTSFTLTPWTSFFHEEIEAQGFTDEVGEARLDHLFVLRGVDAHNEVHNLSSASLKYGHLAVAVIDHDQLYLLPDVEPLKKNIFGRIRAQRVTMITCGAPTLAEIDQFSEISTRLIIVENCGENSKLKYDGLLRAKTDYFAVENLQTSFVEIHMPSFHMALEKKSLNPSMKLAFNFNSTSDPLLRALGWQTPRFDDQIGAFHANSSIEAIKLYRPRQDH